MSSRGDSKSKGKEVSQGGSDEDLASDDYDSDVSQQSHGTRKQNKWFKKFFDSLDSLSVEQINEPQRLWPCPACQNGPGAIDRYNLQPLLAHARTTNGARRVKLHTELAEVLDKDLQIRGASVIPCGENDHEIVWPPMVIMMNTRLGKDDNDKGNPELHEYFNEYPAIRACDSYGPEGHLWMSVLIFESSATGYFEADRLHRDLAQKGFGRDAWDRSGRWITGGVRQLYGFLATKQHLDAFNLNSQGSTRLTYEMKSYHEYVVRQIAEDNQQLNNELSKQSKHAKVLEESQGILSQKQHDQNTEEYEVIETKNVPNDLISLIIEKLPHKSVTRFCAVSSNWATLITGDIARFWSQSFENPRLLFTSFIPGQTFYRWFHSVRQTMPPELWAQNQVKLQRFVSQFPDICQPVRGTTICYGKRGKSAICNPTWRAYKVLPKLSNGLLRSHRTRFYLGFDQEIEVFKVLCVIFYPRRDMEFRVLSLVDENCSWRTVKGVKCYSVDNFDDTAGYSGVFLEGKIYLEAGVSKVMCFDVNREDFRILEVPVQISSGLMKVNNKLGFIKALRIWILEEETWSRLEYSIPPCLSQYKCVGTIDTDKFVFTTTSTPLWVIYYDASSQRLEKIRINYIDNHRDKPVFFEAFIDYIESPYLNFYGKELRGPALVPQENLKSPPPRLEETRLETTRTVPRKFGYNNDIRLADELLPPSLFKRAPDQSVELTDVAIDFLKGMYVSLDDDGDNNLRPQEIEDIFTTAPESSWREAPNVDTAEKTALGGLSFDAFLSLWSLMTLLEPARSVERLICIGFPGDPSSAIRLTRRRRLDRKKHQCERKVFQCFVFGPNDAGKSALLNCFLGRSYADNPESTADERYAVNMVDESGKTLVMREIPEVGAKGLFSSKESLAACDIAVFVYDSSDESSWKRATELLVEAATHGEATGYEVPCLMVSAKDDLDSFPLCIQESTRVTQDMGIEPLVSISSKLGDFNNLLRKILTAAQHPHLSIPETETGKRRKRFNRLINRSLMAVSIGAAVVVVGLIAARKSASA